MLRKWKKKIEERSQYWVTTLHYYKVLTIDDDNDDENKMYNNSNNLISIYKSHKSWIFASFHAIALSSHRNVHKLINRHCLTFCCVIFTLMIFNLLCCILTLVSCLLSGVGLGIPGKHTALKWLIITHHKNSNAGLQPGST